MDAFLKDAVKESAHTVCLPDQVPVDARLDPLDELRKCVGHAGLHPETASSGSCVTPSPSSGPSCPSGSVSEALEGEARPVRTVGPYLVRILRVEFVRHPEPFRALRSFVRIERDPYTAMSRSSRRSRGGFGRLRTPRIGGLLLAESGDIGRVVARTSDRIPGAQHDHG